MTLNIKTGPIRAQTPLNFMKPCQNHKVSLKKDLNLGENAGQLADWGSMLPKQVGPGTKTNRLHFTDSLDLNTLCLPVSCDIDEDQTRVLPTITKEKFQRLHDVQKRALKLAFQVSEVSPSHASTEIHANLSSPLNM